MAGDWIKIRHALPNDPAVITMARVAGKVEPDLIVGKLVKFWIWASEQTSTGQLNGVGVDDIDRIVGLRNFAEGMLEAGWLKRSRGVLKIHNYDAHMSSSAKARAGESIRKAKSRSGLSRRATSARCPDICPDKSVTRAAAESKSEEKKSSSSSSRREHPLQAVAPSTGTAGASGIPSASVAELLLQVRYKGQPVFSMAEAMEVAADSRLVPDQIAYAQYRLDRNKKAISNPPGFARSLMSQKPPNWNASLRLPDLRRQAEAYRNRSSITQPQTHFDPRENPSGRDPGELRSPIDFARPPGG